jgi:hypothetical protein
VNISTVRNQSQQRVSPGWRHWSHALIVECKRLHRQESVSAALHATKDYSDVVFFFLQPPKSHSSVHQPLRVCELHPPWNLLAHILSSCASGTLFHVFFARIIISHDVYHATSWNIASCDWGECPSGHYDHPKNPTSLCTLVKLNDFSISHYTLQQRSTVSKSARQLQHR